MREEANKLLQEKELAHKYELAQLAEAKAIEVQTLAKMNSQTQQHLDKEIKQRQEIEDKYLAHQQRVLNLAFESGRFVYTLCRWGIIILATAIRGISMWASTDHPYITMC